MFKRILAVLLCLSVMFCLCGCDFFTVDTAELLSTPMLSGDLKPISDVLNNTAESGYVLKYPSRGNYRSAVVREDIDGDGLLEAFAFYSTTDGETVNMNINVIAMRNGEWTSVATQKIVAGSIDRVEFSDLDSDGQKEILVGWEIYGTSEMQLAVYDLDEMNLNQKLLQKYTHFKTCDLNSDDNDEILIIKTATAENNNTALLFNMLDESIEQIAACELDSNSKTFNEPVISTLSNGKPAVYIDEIKGAGAVTEVLFLEKDLLVNPLYSPETKETAVTLRSVSFSTTDINNDDILEIPTQDPVPSVIQSESNEKLYLTNWCSFNGENLTVQRTTMINVNDSYSFTIPSRWLGKIAILKDTTSRVREIYRYNKEEETVGESLIIIKAMKKPQWEEEKASSNSGEEILMTDDTVFVAKISDEARAEGVTIDTVKSNFSIFE